MRELFINFIRSVGYHFNDRDSARTPMTLINDEALQDSYQFIRERMSDAALFSNPSKLQDFAIDRACDRNLEDKLILEFGVFKGHTINSFANRLTAAGVKEPIYGFDAFKGLQEDWSQLNFARGHFDLGGRLPKVRANVRLVKGWVQDTLEEFLREHSDRKIAFMHMDMDTYAPTKFVLDKTRDKCGSGTIILFDELYGYPNWRNHEYRALNEIYNEDEYEYLAFGTLQCVIKLI
jgi:hypothetical protein